MEFQFLSHWYDSTPKKSRRKRDSNPGSSALDAVALPLGQRGGRDRERERGEGGRAGGRERERERGRVMCLLSVHLLIDELPLEIVWYAEELATSV